MSSGEEGMTASARMSPAQGRTVLVADDDDQVRAMIAEYLRGHGFVVLEAANGLEALLQVKRERPEAVVLDLAMPRLGGLEALRQIHGSAAEAFVVVITGADDPRLGEQALASGAAVVLRKPVVLAELLGALSRAPTPGAGSARAPQSDPGATPGAAGRVLVVDDDAEVRALLDELLTRHGYTTRSVGDAAKAFWALMEDVPDVVLLDIALPGFSGVEIIPALRFANRDVKIIMISGLTDVGLAKLALAQGAFDYITKPIDLDYLLQSLEIALAMKQLEHGSGDPP